MGSSTYIHAFIYCKLQVHASKFFPVSGEKIYCFQVQLPPSCCDLAVFLYQFDVYSIDFSGSTASSGIGGQFSPFSDSSKFCCLHCGMCITLQMFCYEYQYMHFAHVLWRACQVEDTCTENQTVCTKLIHVGTSNVWQWFWFDVSLQLKSDQCV